MFLFFIKFSPKQPHPPLPTTSSFIIYYLFIDCSHLSPGNFVSIFIDGLTLVSCAKFTVNTRQSSLLAASPFFELELDWVVPKWSAERILAFEFSRPTSVIYGEPPGVGGIYQINYSLNTVDFKTAQMQIRADGRQTSSPRCNFFFRCRNSHSFGPFECKFRQGFRAGVIEKKDSEMLVQQARITERLRKF